MKIIRYLLVFLCICFTFISCEKSTKITDISEIKAKIEIYQSLSDKNDNTVSVILYDKKNKEIVNKSINIFVNGRKADYKVIQSLYYSKNYYYRTENIPPENDMYELKIQLPNEKKFLLGSGSALALSNPDKIIYNKTAPLNKDYSIQWSDLYDVNHLNITKSVQVENTQDPTITMLVDEPDDIINITSNGNYVLKKEKLNLPNGKLRMMILKFTAKKTGTLNPDLLKESTFVIDGNHQKLIDFK
ncbi:hypothetical protein CEY12_11370 [Chryseobacterium sp. T16E-39]|uniref:hypothetical protein n=1 Tax=Chryseobacterium sp. T16E-39 TaxID=2015076 RepID=UPI000B5B2F65|nr:hypothetical protein [Chryseobacterium sp. T16E-39]ASK30676.1 hypothetical protein CEY12_11370 [Chryseobacterium sp. T16E-39]